MTTATPDFWHHYGRSRAATDRAVPEHFSWSWGQDSGPGAEILSDLAGFRVADLGSGAARNAAHLAAYHDPAQVDAVDSSPAQHAMAMELYGQLSSRLRLVHADVVQHLLSHEAHYDVLYSVFGAVDFTDPRSLLPAALAAMRPGGRIVFATLGHYLGGAPAEPDVVPADIPTRRPDGQTATVRRWVLQEHVWVKVLDEAGFARISVHVLPAIAQGPRTAETLLITACRPVPQGTGRLHRAGTFAP